MDVRRGALLPSFIWRRQESRVICNNLSFFTYLSPRGLTLFIRPADNFDDWFVSGYTPTADKPRHRLVSPSIAFFTV
jgi:hypothetical protein